MIQIPNRLADVVRQIEDGQPIDLNRLATLQALDMAVMGRQFLQDQISLAEKANDDVKQLLIEFHGSGERSAS